MNGKEDARSVIGVEANPLERLAIWCANPYGHTPKLAIRIIDQLARRCAESGKCTSDAYPPYILESNSAEALGCPGWCQLASQLDKQVLQTEPADDDVIFF